MKQRIVWIDIAKGIGIIFVILGHISFFPISLKCFIGIFHMPLFFFLAGTVYHGGEIKTFVNNKFRNLIIPYFLFSFLRILFQLCIQIIKFHTNSNFNWKFILKQLLGIFIQLRGTEYGPGLWFIPCIFITLILYFLIEKYFKTKTSIFICIICLILGLLYSSYISVKLPWGCDAALVAVFFLACGHFFVMEQKKYNIKYNSFYISLCIITLILTIIFSQINLKYSGEIVGMYKGHYGNYIYFILGSISGIIFICTTSYLISSIYETLSSIGQFSLYYYGTHNIPLDIVLLFANKIIKNMNFNINILISLSITIIILIILRLLLPLYLYINNKIENYYGICIKNKIKEV